MTAPRFVTEAIAAFALRAAVLTERVRRTSG